MKNLTGNIHHTFFYKNRPYKNIISQKLRTNQEFHTQQYKFSKQFQPILVFFTDNLSC